MHLTSRNWIEAAFAFFCLIIGIAVSISPAGNVLNLKIYDIFSGIKPQPREWDKIVFVNVDDQTIDIMGSWPIDRNKFAKGIAALKDLGADKILLDIEYINPAPLSLNSDYYDTIKEERSSRPLQGILTNLVADPDRDLAKVFGTGPTNVYLACRGVEETKKTRTVAEIDEFRELQLIDQFFLKLKNRSLTNSLPVDKYMESPVFPLYLAAKGLGFTTADKDPDGSLRKIALFRIYKNYLVPQLSLPVIMDELGVDTNSIEIKPGQYIKMTTANRDVIRIPVDSEGRMYINWTKDWTNAFGGEARHIPFVALYDYYNMKKAVNEELPYLDSKDISEDDRNTIKSNIAIFQSLSNKLSVIKGRITITGETANSSTDIGKITIDPSAPLVLMQANIINMIKQKAFLWGLPYVWNILISLAIVLLIYLASIRITSAFRESMASLIIIAGVILIEYLFLAVFGIILNYIMSLTSMISSLALFTGYKFISYDRQKNYIRKAFMQYLSPEVVKEVIENPNLLKLGGERREITAYFSDVAGFTSISEKLTPEEVVTLLNKYLTAMTDIILANGGTVDKYEGDAIVAFFGAPIPHKDHAARCCNAAVDMQNALISLREEWIKEGYPLVTARMGINTGPAIIGNMGSQQRMDYTMMGDTVNTASRFEGANKAYGTYTMISEFTCNQVKDRFVVRKLDLLRVVGKTTPTEVFELVGRAGEVAAEKIYIIDEYHKALQEYRNKNWEAAVKLFGELSKNSNDPPSKTYLERCQKYRKNPPPADWDGVFVLSSK